MKHLIFFFITLSCTHTLYARKNSITDTTVYEYRNLFSNGDTSFFKSYFLNDSLLVRKEYYGKVWDATSITASGTDTFIVSKSKWKKVFNGNVYSFLSESDFAKKQVVKEYTRIQNPPNTYNLYTPVKKVKAGNDVIYVYDMDVVHGKAILYSDTRVYFSLKYGIIGYISSGSEMLIKKFAGKIIMELRKPKYGSNYTGSLPANVST